MTDPNENMANRHRHCKAWDGPVPLTEMPWNWRVTLWWAAIGIGTCALAWAGWKSLQLLWSVLNG